MNEVKSRYSTVCLNRKSGAKVFEADVTAASAEEAETRGFVTCVRAGNNYDEVEVTARKIDAVPTIH